MRRIANQPYSLNSSDPCPVRSHSTRKLSLRKRVLFAILVVAVSVGFLELGALVVYRVVMGEPLKWSVVHREQDQLRFPHQVIDDINSATAAAFRRHLSLHPYLGYVFNPQSNTRRAVSEFGFVDQHEPLQTRAADKVIVGILGGSVAHGFSVHGAPVLARELQRDRRFANKEFVFLRLCLGGYKQPQQLLLLSYLLSLGAEFDIIINMDGFNEVALHEPENAPRGVFAAFPRAWHLLAANAPDEDTQLMLARLTLLRKQRRAWANMFSKMSYRYSPTANLSWRVVDRQLAAAIAEQVQEFQEHQPHELPHAAVGPTRRYADSTAMYTDLAAIWQQGSLQLHNLCRANGIAYYHFLQPNQYVAHSKPMGAREKARAVVENPYQTGVERGYPHLIQRGRELQQRGVAFVDLTMAFADHPEPLYVDTCCHLNPAGNAILAKRAARAIVDSTFPPSRSRPPLDSILAQ